MSDDQAESQAGPGVVVLHWSKDKHALVQELARTVTRVGVERVTCVRDGQWPDAESMIDDVEVLERSIDAPLGSDAFCESLRELEVVKARAVIVLPRASAEEPDSGSRLSCAAIRKACGDQLGPNLIVEIEDPEAAFEFVGLGVATVFYSGHLRAALLGQACVDLGVFQFVVGLLRGRHHLRSLPVPEHLREANFADAAIELECDEHGRPMTIIGVGKTGQQIGQAIDVLVNPGPRSPLRDVMCLMALVSGDREQGDREQGAEA